jgi:hypothetical protein
MLTFFTDTMMSDRSWAMKGDARTRRVIHEADAYENRVDGRDTAVDKKVAAGDGEGEATGDANSGGDRHDDGEGETDEEAVGELVDNITVLSI